MREGRGHFLKMRPSLILFLCYLSTNQKCGHLFGVRVDDVAVSVHRYQGDAGAGEEHRHALDAANRLTEPGL